MSIYVAIKTTILVSRLVRLRGDQNYDVVRLYERSLIARHKTNPLISPAFGDAKSVINFASNGSTRSYR